MCTQDLEMRLGRCTDDCWSFLWRETSEGSWWEKEEYSLIRLHALVRPVVVRRPVGSFSSIPVSLSTHVSSRASLMSVDNRKKYLSDLLTGQLLNISVSFEKKMELPQFISAGHLTHGLH